MVFFDNVGGEILDAALARLAVGARVVLCGAISAYNDADLGPGLRNYTNLIIRRRTDGGVSGQRLREPVLQGDRRSARWAGEGKIRHRVDVVDGLENAPAAFIRLFTGQNIGKQLVRIAGLSLGEQETLSWFQRSTAATR